MSREDILLKEYELCQLDTFDTLFHISYYDTDPLILQLAEQSVREEHVSS